MGLFALIALFGCQVEAGQGSDEGTQAAAATLDPLKQIFDEVDGDRIIQSMRDLSGVDLVDIGGTMVRIDERFSSDGRKRFRQYFTQFMENLGLEVNQFHYQAARHPRGGDNVEAILRGKSPDSFIVIVHYDSIGPRGRETQNPGADDDMSGMSILLETARLFVRHRDQLAFTVRFVATDEEEVISCGMVIRSIGYRGAPLAGIPFDERKGLISNLGGRVLGHEGEHEVGEYVVGWVKRGPSGVIGTNKKDATDTVARIIEDRDAGTLNTPKDADLAACEQFLSQQCPQLVTWEGWRAIDVHETGLGEPQGRPRVKLVRTGEMVDVANASKV